MFQIEEHHLLYPKEEWAKYDIFDRLICPIERRPHTGVHTMVEGIRVPSDIEKFAKLEPPHGTPSAACEWLARRTTDVETRKDLLAEAYILASENL